MDKTRSGTGKIARDGSSRWEATELQSAPMQSHMNEAITHSVNHELREKPSVDSSPTYHSYLPAPPSRLGRISLDNWRQERLQSVQERTISGKTSVANTEKKKSKMAETLCLKERDESVKRSEQCVVDGSLAEGRKDIETETGNKQGNETTQRQKEHKQGNKVVFEGFGQKKGGTMQGRKVPSPSSSAARFRDGEREREGWKGANARKQQELLRLRSCARNQLDTHLGRRSKVNTHATSSTYRHGNYEHYHEDNYGHMSDVTLPPSPPHMELGIGLKSYQTLKKV